MSLTTPDRAAGRGTRTAIALLRGALALVLLLTGLGKALDISGFAEVVATYGVLPRPLLLPAALALTATELALSAWLASGWRLRYAGLAAAALHAMFLVWASIALARGLAIPNCGCFGIFFARPLSTVTLLEDALLIAASVTLAALSRR